MRRRERERENGGSRSGYWGKEEGELQRLEKRGGGKERARDRSEGATARRRRRVLAVALVHESATGNEKRTGRGSSRLRRRFDSAGERVRSRCTLRPGKR